MHYIQKAILDKLRVDGASRYVDLNVHSMESSHFRYHLEQLVKDGCVKKVARGRYTLTDSGISLMDRLSSHKTTPQPMPKTITYYLLSDDRFVYLHRKDKEPYRGLLNMVGGKIHEGETSNEAARRELSEKIGLEVEDLKLRGVFEVRIFKNTKLFTHAIAFVYSSGVTNACIDSMEAVLKSDLQSRKDLAPDFISIYEHILDSPDFISKIIDIKT